MLLSVWSLRLWSQWPLTFWVVLIVLIFLTQKQIWYECDKLLFYPRAISQEISLGSSDLKYKQFLLWEQVVTWSAYSYSTESLRKETSWVAPGFTSFVCFLLLKNHCSFPTENLHFSSMTVIMACLFLIIVSHDWWTRAWEWENNLEI